MTTSSLSRRVEKLESEAGVRSADQTETERMSRISHACLMVENYPSRASDEDKAIVASTTKDEQNNAFVFVLTGRAHPGGFTGMVRAVLAIPLGQIPPPERMVSDWMAELERAAPDLADDVRAGRKDVEKAARELYVRWGSHVPSGPQPEDEFSVPPRAEALAAQEAHERRRELGSDQGDTLRAQAGPVPAPPPFNPRDAWIRDMQFAEQRERIRQAQSEVYHPFGKDW